MSKKQTALDIAAGVLKYSSPLTYAIYTSAEVMAKKVNDVSENGTIKELEEEAIKQKIFLKMSEAQAKVAQELAIARRIDTAEEVIIEEFYDTAGAAGLGANIKEDGLSAGLTASGRQVSKRVYTFKGWKDGGLENLEKLLSNYNKDDK